jgi:tellurite resistance protein TerC
MVETIWPWIVFNACVIAMLVLDLFVFHRQAHVISIKQALLLSGIWIGIALLFNVGIFFVQGEEAALNFFTGYVIEKSLSIDNLFVFIVIFNYFQTPPQYLHKVLFWGILGAIVMRAVFIFCGIALVTAFHWILYIFGIFLIFIGIKMAFHKAEQIRPENNPSLKVLRKWMSITNTYVEDKFFVKRFNQWYATPLFVVLLSVESTDVVFAIDSIPAIMAITLDPFIVYTSNIFAILGLRALYFALSRTMQLFHFLNYGLAAILIFVGIKMLIAPIVKIPIIIALGFIVAVLALSIIASLIFPPQKDSPENDTKDK